MSSLKLLHSGGNGVIISAPSSNPSANRTITLNDTYAGDGSFVTANSSGDVGIGTASPSTKLHVDGDITLGDSIIHNGDTDTKIRFPEADNVTVECAGNERFRLKPTNDVAIFTGSNSATLTIRNDTANQMQIHTGSSDQLVFGTNGENERMRLESSGTLVWTGANTQYVQMTHSGDVMIVQTEGTSAANHGMIQFRDGGGTYCGQITSHGTNHTTSYVTNSDYRLKQNEVLISDGITRLKQLKPYRFKWKSSGNEVDGFFAHEAQAIVPESVIGTKNEIDSDKNPIYQGIDQSKLVPLLTAALQEAVAKIEVLETKVAALEAA